MLFPSGSLRRLTCKGVTSRAFEFTHVLVWYNLHALDMSRRLKNLLQNILCDSWIESTNIQRSLVRFWSSAPNACANRRSEVVAGHGSVDSRWDRIVVLRDVERWDCRWWHMAARAILVAGLAWRSASRWRQWERSSRSSIRHYCDE